MEILAHTRESENRTRGFCFDWRGFPVSAIDCFCVLGPDWAAAVRCHQPDLGKLGLVARRGGYRAAPLGTRGGGGSGVAGVGSSNGCLGGIRIDWSSPTGFKARVVQLELASAPRPSAFRFHQPAHHRRTLGSLGCGTSVDRASPGLRLDRSLSRRAEVSSRRYGDHLASGGSFLPAGQQTGPGAGLGRHPEPHPDRDPLDRRSGAPAVSGAGDSGS